MLNRIPIIVKYVVLVFLCTKQISAYNGYDSVQDIGATHPEENPNQLRLWLTISAQKRFLEISWKNAPAHDKDHLLLTKNEPHSFERVQFATGTPLATFNAKSEVSALLPIDGFTSTTTKRTKNSSGEALSQQSQHYWISNKGRNDIVAAIKPDVSAQWFTTGVPFDFELSRNVTSHTGCYGYWASYINGSGDILATTCLRAYPRWMYELRSVVGGLRVRDLFIPGTHDSGSYRPNFDPLLRERLVTKYALTQDDDIRGQLLHGARYLDIRVGYHRNTPELFYINHGITRQRPLQEVIEQVKDFVMETNEIVIFGLKEFPVGFGKSLGVHRLLVKYLRDQFGDLIVHPSATWQASLRDIWSRRQNVILAYDKGAVVQEFPHTLFASVEQRWGKALKWIDLERHLRSVNSFDVSRLSSRPVADMAELTPDTWGVILDKYGGLRKMADNVNWRVSQLYRDELGSNANIVAVDFIRGTSLMEIAIEWNKRKVIY